MSAKSLLSRWPAWSTCHCPIRFFVDLAFSSEDTAKMIGHSVVSLQLDYANALLYGMCASKSQQAASGTEHTGDGDKPHSSVLHSYADSYTGCQFAKK